MRTAAVAATFLLLLTACSSSNNSSPTSPFTQPNSLMAEEISRRVEQIPYLHREELLENLLWLSQSGEQCIPAMLTGLRHEHPKVRSSSAWILGRLGDRRTIPQLQAVLEDSEPTVRLECARTLVLLGDLVPSPILIEGLDSDRKEVRYLCHEALKTSTGHDFGYDHLAVDQAEMRGSVLRWRQWWSEYSGDPKFAANYQSKYGIADKPASPGGEIRLSPAPVEMPMPSNDAAAPGVQVPVNPASQTPAPATPVPGNVVPVVEIEGRDVPIVGAPVVPAPQPEPPTSGSAGNTPPVRVEPPSAGPASGEPTTNPKAGDQ